MSEFTRVMFAIVPAVLVGVVSFSCFVLRPFPVGYIYFMIPVYSYIISLIASSVYQSITCDKVQIQSIALSNLGVLGTSTVASFVLFLENLHLKKLFFDPEKLVPIYPTTGDPVPEASPAYRSLLDSELHYKFQFFSPIVRAVLPMGMASANQEGLVYFYWIFWMVFLPMYFLLSLQGFC